MVLALLREKAQEARTTNIKGAAGGCNSERERGTSLSCLMGLMSLKSFVNFVHSSRFSN